MNLKIREFKVAIQNYVDGSGLPEEVKRLVLNEILAEQSQKALSAISAELEERDRKEAEQDE